MDVQYVLRDFCSLIWYERQLLFLPIFLPFLCTYSQQHCKSERRERNELVKLNDKRRGIKKHLVWWFGKFQIIYTQTFCPEQPNYRVFFIHHHDTSDFYFATQNCARFVPLVRHVIFVMCSKSSFIPRLPRDNLVQCLTIRIDTD